MKTFAIRLKMTQFQTLYGEYESESDIYKNFFSDLKSGKFDEDFEWEFETSEGPEIYSVEEVDTEEI